MVLGQNVMEEWLTEEFDYESPLRGNVCGGEILQIDERGVIVDLGFKRDGFIPRSDIERLGDDTFSTLERGQEVKARIVHLEDDDGNLLLSMFQARFERDWTTALQMLESGDLWRGTVKDTNRGGLLVEFNNLRGFVPASHLETSSVKRLPTDQREDALKDYVGKEITLQVIEVDRNRRRLILSERLAVRQLRTVQMERLLDELEEGQVVQGKVSQLRPFGAFVDLGGAAGLIHNSELAWCPVRHPGDVVKVGDEIDVLVLRLDHERKRVGLSLKRLQPDPWNLVDQVYEAGQLVAGRVTNIVDFGAFVALDVGVEGLVHVSELADSPPSHPREIVERDENLLLRILRIDTLQERISLSLKYVSEEERNSWLGQQVDGDTEEPDRQAMAEFENQVEETQPTGVVTEEPPIATGNPDEERPVEESHPVLERQPGDEEYWLNLVENEEAEEV